MIKVNDVEVKTWKFPSGEVGVNVESLSEFSKIFILKASLRNNDDIMELLMVSDAIDRRYINHDKRLYLDYIPYGRQDRVSNDGDSLSLSVFAKMINLCNFKSVGIIDPHSDVTTALINNSCAIKLHDIIAEDTQFFDEDFVVVAPDAGAYKRALGVAERFGASEVITCLKSRNMKTGEITNLSFTGDVKGKNVLVVDDIIDKGGTFIQLAENLTEAKSKKLLVSHGLFTGGYGIVTAHYDEVLVLKPWCMEDIVHPKIKTVNKEI